MNEIIDNKRLVGFDGELFGTAGQQMDTSLGGALLVHRAENLGGGIIVLPTSELEEHAEEIITPYGELSIREAPPYSSDVPLMSYLRYWKRLGVSNSGQSGSEFVTANSGPVAGLPSTLTDDQIAGMVNDGIQQVLGVSSHLIEITVKNGTVLLQGDQSDTSGRLAAGQAAANVPGVKQIVNMIVIRAVF